MTVNKAEPAQGYGNIAASHPPSSERGCTGNTVLKSGHLYISSKGGIGWTTWKKRWFILTSTSLVFYRSDPNAVPQKGGEVNLTLGGIDLNDSGSVVVKAGKKLLTVLFPNGRDGRAFTLKAETLEDLYEWKTALESAMVQAPNASIVDQNGIMKNEQTDGVNGSSGQSRDKPNQRSVIGRPVLLALEDVDGSPSFLEKALRFIEEHGVKVEGILRQAAYVEDVERRIQEYEQGKTEFSSDEDAHVIADCVKYFLRELSSYPVPASCCNALLDACRTDRSVRINAMRGAISETFPEPNRRLLDRVLLMMKIVASHKEKNRMSSSAVAACMAPLLLRPLLVGDCAIENDFDVGGDEISFQLLQAAAAANHAQAIVTTLLDDYGNIFRFQEGTTSPDMYSDTEESGTESEEATDGDYSYEEGEEDDCTKVSDEGMEDDDESGYSGNDSICDEKGRKNLLMEDADCSLDDEEEVHKLEVIKSELQNSIAEEVEKSATLKANLERRKRELHDFRLSLEKDLTSLQNKIQEAGLDVLQDHVSVSSSNDSMTGDHPGMQLQKQQQQKDKETNNETATSMTPESSTASKGNSARSNLTNRLNFQKKRYSGQNTDQNSDKN